tara:strand:- start:617 stop:1102 length:486 start_codon:yes stop_codon:yes gene_type:complete
MNIEACDKGSGKKEQITISNNKDRLSADDIEQMIQEAEKFKDEDNEIKEKIESKNNLESLLFEIKTYSNNEEIKSKLSDEEKEKVSNTITEVESWIVEDRTKDEYDKKYTEITTDLGQIISKVKPSPEGVQPGVDPATMDPKAMEEMMKNMNGNPTIDEVD